MDEINSNEIFRVAHDNEEGNKFSLQDAKGIKQSESSLDLSNTSRLGRWVFESGANAANRTACEIGKQFDPVTRGEYDQYLVKRTIKAWKESCDTLRNACTFSRWIGWAYFKFMFQFGNKLKELLKLSNPEEAIKKGMPPEAFFAWQNILSFEKKKIDIVNNDGDTTDKLQLSYNPQDGLTANIIDSQSNATPIKITTISPVKSDDTLFCLHTENEEKILVNKTDLLTIGLVLKEKVSLKQFFVENNVPSFEDRAIILSNDTAIKLSYDANSTSEDDGISLYCYFKDYTTLSIEPCLNGFVRLYGIRDGGNSPTFISLFQTENLQNFVNSLRTTENSNSSEQEEQEGDPINQFFGDQDAVPFKVKDFNSYFATIQNDNTSQFSSISVNSYGNNCVNLKIFNKNSEWFHTQNVRIKDYPNSDVVGISGQYWDKNEKGWKNFNNVTVNQAQLLQCKRGDKTVPSWPTTIRLVNFLLRNDALPSENQTRTLTATQLDGPNSKDNNKEVQIEINNNGDVSVGDDTLKDINLDRDESCKDGEAIIRGHDENWAYSEYKINLNDLLGKDDNK